MTEQQRQRSMLGHLSFGVRDLERTTHFYDAILTPLGHVRVWTSGRGVGFGEGRGDERLTLFARADDAALEAVHQ